MEHFLAQLGARLLLVRKSRRLTQKKVAEMLAGSYAFPRTSLSKWENGQAEPPLAFLAAFSEALDVSCHWLLTGEGAMLAEAGLSQDLARACNILATLPPAKLSAVLQVIEGLAEAMRTK